MTERLSALLHEEAARLDVPAPLPGEALVAGRRIRRRRRLAAQAAGVAALAVAIGVGGALAGTGHDSNADRIADTPTTAEAVDLPPAYGSGDTLYIGDGARKAVLDEVVQTIYYTSAGYLVRTNATGDSDGGDPFHFVLVTPDGRTSPLDLTLGEVVPSTDAAQPYLAYAETADSGQVNVVVLDVRTGDQVARVDLSGLMVWHGAWDAPPVALDGNLVYVATKDVTQVVNWRTGEVTSTDLITGYPSVAGGRSVVSSGNGVRIVDVASGETLFEPSGQGAWFARLSPDGRYALVFDQVRQRRAEAYDLDSGTHVLLDGDPSGYGWTVDGNLFSVSPQGVEECAAATGTCTTTPLADGVRLDDAVYFVRMAGVAYES
jgi:hypothetical protein